MLGLLAKTSDILRGEEMTRETIEGGHRIRHYGLLATATCKANVARAKQLIAAPLPSIDPSTEHDDPDVATGAAADHRLPCPHCGGRMIIVESFGRSGEPRAPPP